MGKDTLKNYVLTLADADKSLSEHARLAVLAALEDPDVLSEALGGTSASPHLVEALTAADESAEAPVGAYLDRSPCPGSAESAPRLLSRFSRVRV